VALACRLSVILVLALSANAPHRRWSILALLFTTRVALGFQFQTMGSVAEPVAADLHLNYTQVGTLIGLFLMPGVVLAMPAGLLGRYLSDRLLVAIGLVALTAGGTMAAASTSLETLAAGRLLGGAGFVVCSLYFTKMTADWFAGRELATAMAVVVMSWPFGVAMGQIGHGWVAAHEGWRMPFVVAALYSLLSAVAVLVFYSTPPQGAAAPAAPSARLTGREWSLTLIAAFIWATFNAAYVVYLSFAPRVLTDGGMSALTAASIVSLASWVMIFSGTLVGQVADRFGRADLILRVCLIGGMVSLALLPLLDWAILLSLAYGLIGVAPAGLVMALTGQAMAPHKRAFGMGVFLSVFFLGTAPAPGIAGWLYDRTGNAYVPILFAVGLTAAALAGTFAFRAVQRATR
jgi:predicted MFS family arabinose efflux permease